MLNESKLDVMGIKSMETRHEIMQALQELCNQDREVELCNQNREVELCNQEQEQQKFVEDDQEQVVEKANVQVKLQLGAINKVLPPPPSILSNSSQRYSNSSAGQSMTESESQMVFEQNSQRPRMFSITDYETALQIPEAVQVEHQVPSQQPPVQQTQQVVEEQGTTDRISILSRINIASFFKTLSLSSQESQEENIFKGSNDDSFAEEEEDRIDVVGVLSDAAAMEENGSQESLDISFAEVFLMLDLVRF